MRSTERHFHRMINYSFWDELSISKEEHVALKVLSTNKDLIIQKLDKGNSRVLLNRNNCIKPMNEMLSDCSKLDIKPGKEILYYSKRTGLLIY